MLSDEPLVFVSYASEDAAVAKRLAGALRDGGFRAWLYQQDSLPGESYLQQIHTAISNSGVVAVLVSFSSLHSHQVAKEVVLGHDLGKPFLPILLGVSHQEMQKQNVDYRTAFGAASSVPLTPENFEEVSSRIVEGLRRILTTNCHETKGTSQPSGAGHEEGSAHETPHEWTSLSNRLQNFHPEVVRLRQSLQRAWPTPKLGNSAECSLAGERVRVADSLLNDLFHVVSQEWAKAPKGCVIVARGGYGRGVLSVGSDIDIALVHPRSEEKEAENFWRPFATALTDVWNVIRGIRTAPTILGTDESVQSWRKFQIAGDLSPLVSFAFTRPLAGRIPLHDVLRLEWRTYIKELPSSDLAVMLDVLRKRVQANPLVSDRSHFDTKRAAGGILEYRLTGFLEQVIDIRTEDSDLPGYSVPEAHHFLLQVREAVFNLTQSHVLTDHHAARVATILFPGTVPSGQRLALDEELLRQRRRIRTGFGDALDAVEALL